MDDIKPVNDYFKQRSERRRKTIESFQGKYLRKRNRFERIVDSISAASASMGFLVANSVFFIIWILWNMGLIGIKAVDPFPFVLLTTVVSLEAIILSIFVLISQNRQSRVADLREEIDLQINLIAEEEITKLIKLMTGLYKALNVDVGKDPELQTMLQPVNTDEIERRLEEHLLGNHQNNNRRSTDNG